MKYSTIVLCVLLLAGCSKIEPQNQVPKKRADIVLTKSQMEVVSLGNKFTFDLLKQINTLETTQENIFVSPMSAQMAFSMASAGALGETQNEMLSAMGMDNVSQEDVNKYFQMIVPALENVDNTTTFTTANSVWVKKDCLLKSAYKSYLHDYYDAEGRIIDSNSGKAVSEINDWCSDHTNGMIDHIIDEIDPELRMMLINALYFKGVWVNKFDAADNKDLTFYNHDGTTTKTTFMCNTFDSPVWYDETVAAINLPYGNSAFRMTVVLPADETDIDAFISTIDLGKWNNWIHGNGEGPYEVILSFPKFTTEYDAGNTLVPALKNMGMKLAFSPTADFSDMSQEPLFIGSANQLAKIIVNEKGTEAAAVTYTGMCTSAGPINATQFSFTVDHPFLYFISEISTGAILFAGVQKGFRK